MPLNRILALACAQFPQQNRTKRNPNEPMPSAMSSTLPKAKLGSQLVVATVLAELKTGAAVTATGAAGRTDATSFSAGSADFSASTACCDVITVTPALDVALTISTAGSEALDALAAAVLAARSISLMFTRAANLPPEFCNLSLMALRPAVISLRRLSCMRAKRSRIKLMRESNTFEFPRMSLRSALLLCTFFDNAARRELAEASAASLRTRGLARDFRPTRFAPVFAELLAAADGGGRNAAWDT